MTNRKLNPTTCDHCGGIFHVIDTIEGACLECALEGTHRKQNEVEPLRTYTLRKWFDDSLLIKRINRKFYRASRGGETE